MQRSAKWYREQAERGEREVQAVVYRNAAGAPAARGSAAQSLFPNHSSSFREFEIVRRDAPQRSIAGRIYPNLRER